jgi:hypothetical protein
MKREDLKKLELSDEAIDKIMAMHGADVEKHKTAADTAKAESDGLKAQLSEANTTIEGFKKLDVDGIKAAADEWKTKAEAAQTEAAKQIQALKYDYALDGALSAAKVKNAKALKALLDGNSLKFNEADGSIIGLDDQLKKVKESDAYLFTDETPPPTITAGGTSKSVISDAAVSAARKAAGLPV